MGRKVNTITLTEEQRSYLELQTRARTIQAQTVCRARYCCYVLMVFLLMILLIK